MKKSLCFLSALFCLISASAYANLGIFPQAVDFFDNSNKRSQTLNVTNHSDRPQTYRVKLIHYTQDEEGQYHEARTTSNMADKYLVYSPRQFTLRPGKMQAIRVARKGGDLKDGEYISHLLVSEVEMPQPKEQKNSSQNSDSDVQTLSIKINTLFAISVPVTIYKGDLEPKTKLISSKVNKDKLELVLQRQGNVSSRFNVKVYDKKGEIIAQPGPFRIYTPNGKRHLIIDLKKGSKPVKLEIIDALSNENIITKNL